VIRKIQVLTRTVKAACQYSHVLIHVAFQWISEIPVEGQVSRGGQIAQKKITIWNKMLQEC